MLSACVVFISVAGTILDTRGITMPASLVFLAAGGMVSASKPLIISRLPRVFEAGGCFLLPFLAAIWTVSASQLPIISRLLRFFASGVHFLLPFLAAIRAVLLPRKELKNRQP